MSSKRKSGFQIRGFKSHVIMDPEYGDKTWNIIEHAIHLIYNHNTSDLSFEELYRNAYNMILHKFGEKLHSGLVAAMTSHLKEMARSLEATQGSSFLEELNTKWNDHNEALRMIRDIMIYADMIYFSQTMRTRVYELGLNLWRENVIYSDQIRTRLSNMLLEFVFKERAAEDAEDVNRELIRNLLTMLMDLGPSVYEKEFETPFLKVSAEFYRDESQKFVEFSDCGEYLKKTAKRLNEEKDRQSYLLDTWTKEKITNMLKETIENHMLRLIQIENSGLVNMLCGDKYEDLGRMYNLFHRVP